MVGSPPFRAIYFASSIFYVRACNHYRMCMMLYESIMHRCRPARVPSRKLIHLYNVRHTHSLNLRPQLNVSYLIPKINTCQILQPAQRLNIDDILSRFSGKLFMGLPRYIVVSFVLRGWNSCRGVGLRLVFPSPPSSIFFSQKKKPLVLEAASPAPVALITFLPRFSSNFLELGLV